MFYTAISNGMLTFDNCASISKIIFCYTPTWIQYCGMKFGVGPDGNARSQKPEDVEQAVDWCQPGGPRNRENCIKLLVERGANINEKDYQNFTILHFAAMWGKKEYNFKVI